MRTNHLRTLLPVIGHSVRILATILFGTLVITAPRPVAAVTADVTSGPSFGALGTATTHDLLAFSDVPAGGGPNALRKDSILGTVVGVGAVARFDDGICVGGFFFGCARFYTPPIGFRNRPKPTAATPYVVANAGSASVESVTNAVIGLTPVAATGAAFFTPPAGGAAGGLSASGTIAPAGFVGRAAGEAIDPFELPAGNYSYLFEIDGILLQTEEPGDFAGVTLFATDSRSVDPLWTLAVSVTGLFATKEDLLVQFFSNPILNLNDTDVVNDVRNAFAISNSTAQLLSHQLFNTTYPVSQTIQFSEGVNAGVEAVPEPSTLFLLGTGLAGLIGSGTKRLFKKA